MSSATIPGYAQLQYSPFLLRKPGTSDVKQYLEDIRSTIKTTQKHKGYIISNP